MMSAGESLKRSATSELGTSSSISELSQIDKSPRQSLIDPVPQNLYSTAQRYKQTNKQNLLKKLQTTVKSRRSKLFYSILCVITFVISYQFILYLMTDLSNNYNYKKPLFIQYISYSLFPIIFGLLMVKPLWIIANKYHKSLTNQRIIISDQNAKHYDSPFLKKNTFNFGFSSKLITGKRIKNIDNISNGTGQNEKKLSSVRSDINSTNNSYFSDDDQYEYDEEYDEYDGDSLLNDNNDGTIKRDNDSLTELGMISEISFNNIDGMGMNGMIIDGMTGSNTYKSNTSKSNITTTTYQDSFDIIIDDYEDGTISNFSHSKPTTSSIYNRDKTGLLQPYFKELTISSPSGHSTVGKLKDIKQRKSYNPFPIKYTSSNINKIENEKAKSECHLLLDQEEKITLHSKTRKETRKDIGINNKIVVTSNRDISNIPQSVYFTLDLPHRAFKWQFNKIGLKIFIILFILNTISSILWLLSIQNGINIHEQMFYIENCIHSGRIIICYILSILCLTNLSSMINYKSLNLMNCQNLFSLSMLIVGLIVILIQNIDIFNKYNIQQLIILSLSPLFNGILIMYLQYISSEFFYKKNFWMFLGDILFILGINGIINLCILWIVILLSDFTGFEVFILPNNFHIIWRLILICFLWWLYNISLFIGITLLNSIVMGFGFAMIVPCNIIFDQTINIFNININKEILLLIAICLISLSFIIYEMHFYVWYVLYCGSCRIYCDKSGTSCIRWINKKTKYRLYGKFNCCCIYRCCCC